MTTTLLTAEQKRQKNFPPEMVKVIKTAFGSRPLGRGDRTKENYAKAETALLNWFQPHFAPDTPFSVLETLRQWVKTYSKSIFDTYAFTKSTTQLKGVNFERKTRRDIKKMTRGDAEQYLVDARSYADMLTQSLNDSVPPEADAPLHEYMTPTESITLLRRNRELYLKSGANLDKLTNPDLKREQKLLKKAAKASTKVNGNEAHVAG